MAEKLELGCAVLGSLCLIYYVVIVLYAGFGVDFAWFWAAGGIGFLLYRLLIHHGALHPQGITAWAVRIILALLVTGFITAGAAATWIIGAMTAKAPQNLDYVIVLGAHVRGTVPSRALRKRLDCAKAYAEENPDTIFFLSGGQGSGEDITEAEAMYRYLTEKGVDGDRLIFGGSFHKYKRKSGVLQSDPGYQGQKGWSPLPTISMSTGQDLWQRSWGISMWHGYLHRQMMSCRCIM